MRLSDAIRKGIKILPNQAFGQWWDGPFSGCAMWTAYVAADMLSLVGKGNEAFQQAMPELVLQAVCPACGVPSTRFDIVSNHLNDQHRWTRERIADWLDTLDVDPITEEFHKVANEAALIGVMA